MRLILFAISTLLVVTGAIFASSKVPFGYDVYEDPQNNTVATSSPGFSVVHVKTPEQVKGIYMSGWVGGSSKLRNKLVTLIDETELNAVVLDIKDYTGKLSFLVEDNPKLAAIGSGEERISDIKEFIGFLHEKGIYVIGRVSTFQDPYFVKIHPEYAVKTKSGAVWQDRKGIKWLDAGAEPVWEYFVDIAKASYDVGFDEINFDYIRFPSDGNMSDIAFTYSGDRPKHEVLKSFFAYVDTNLRKKEKIPISADFFGMVTSNTDDLGIGQVLEDGLAHFDYISPMVYPSHYPVGFNGWKNPNEKPYDLIQYALSRAVTRTKSLDLALNPPAATSTSTSTSQVLADVSTGMIRATTTRPINPRQIRPWLQDFTLGGVVYTPDKVRAQIQATYDVGLDSWLLWNASNVYSKDALLPEQVR